MKWRPINKRTGQEYPAITDGERKEKWASPPYSTHFRFEAVEETPRPTEAKAAKQETPPAQAEKGLDQPNG